MSEEKKEEQKKEEKKPEEKAPQAEKKQPEEKKPAAEKKPEAPPAAAAPPPEKPKRPMECISCNKGIKEKWYYREGKYYCTKSCWKKTKKKEAAKPAEDKAKTEDKK